MDGLPLRQAAVIGLFTVSLLAHVFVAQVCSMQHSLQSDLLLTPAWDCTLSFKLGENPEKTLSHHLEAKLQIQ